MVHYSTAVSKNFANCELLNSLIMLYLVWVLSFAMGLVR